VTEPARAALPSDVSTTAARSASPAQVKAMLGDGEELALVDLREELIYSQSHLLWARSIPLSRLELKFARLVPRLTTRIVLCDDDDGLAERASQILARARYTNLFIMKGGVAAWAAAGFELFSGVNVPSKAFGEHVEHSCDTPSISAEELHTLMRDGANMVVLDSRPFDEYQRISIPTATSVPGAELVLRVHDLAPSPETLVVVNCAGRTRSIIGAQSLINAGVPNKVVALRNGTMGWNLAGFSCEKDKQKKAPQVSSKSLGWAKSAAERVAHRFAIERIDRAKLNRWRAEENERTLYVFDVRDPAEYEAGHVAGAISAPGGQLVQATDQYAATLGARIVLVDDSEVRAAMTASWLRQMGLKDVFVLVQAGTEKGLPLSPIIGTPPRAESAIDCATLSAELAKENTTVIDLSPSRDYRKGHISGAWFAIRSRLAKALDKIMPHGPIVLTSEDGLIAGLAVAEVSGATKLPVQYLKGGNAAWKAAGYPLSTEARMADEAVDAWLKPYERSGDTKGAMSEYLAWETDLLPRIARDGTCHFIKA
jgi:rhodanese-related sulfurtransferase